MKRSAAVVELETQLKDMIGQNRGLLEARWVGRFVEFLRETENHDGRLFLLNVLMSTPLSEKATLTRFVQLQGIEILRDWIEEHRRSTNPDEHAVLNSILSTLNKLTITIEILDRTKVGKKVGALARHSDPAISAKAGSLISKWKKLLAPKEERKTAKPKRNDDQRVGIKT